MRKKSIVLILVMFLFAFSVVSTSADPTGAVYIADEDQPWGGEAPEKYTAVPQGLQWLTLGMQLSLVI